MRRRAGSPRRTRSTGAAAPRRTSRPGRAGRCARSTWRGRGPPSWGRRSRSRNRRRRARRSPASARGRSRPADRRGRCASQPVQQRRQARLDPARYMFDARSSDRPSDTARPSAAASAGAGWRPGRSRKGLRRRRSSPPHSGFAPAPALAPPRRPDRRRPAARQVLEDRDALALPGLSSRHSRPSRAGIAAATGAPASFRYLSSAVS